MEAESSSTGYAETRGPRALRKACEVFSWKNRDLLDMLRGEQQAHYFNPQWLRGSDLHTMMLALGMPEELSKDNFLSMARDIEAFTREAKSSLGNNLN